MFFLLTFLCITSSVLAAYPKPGACSGICNNAHDPSIVRREDGTYFRFSTGGKIAIHSAPAITGPWTYRGPAIRAGSKINLARRDDLWVSRLYIHAPETRAMTDNITQAPDVAKVGATYHLYYTVSAFSSQSSAIGHATSIDLLSWIDHGATGIASDRSKPYNAIDANLFQYNDSGGSTTMLMSFGSFWGGIYQVPMASANRVSGAAAAKPVVYQPAGDHAIEAAYLFADASLYYMFFSAGRCCKLDRDRPAPGQEYRIMVCRASGPAGPFWDRSGRSCRAGGGTLVLSSHGHVYAPGGQGAYRDAVLGPVLYYHFVDRRVGYGDGQKVFGWNRLDFSSGWPVVV